MMYEAFRIAADIGTQEGMANIGKGLGFLAVLGLIVAIVGGSGPGNGKGGKK